MTFPKKGKTPGGSPNRRPKKGPRRSKTLTSRRLTTEEVREAEEIQADYESIRPTSRVHCKTGPRPCPFVSCKFHLYLDVHPETGSIKLNFPDLEVWEKACFVREFLAKLDIAEVSFQGEVPEQSIREFQKHAYGYPLEAGNSRANAYHWICTLNSLGRVDRSVHADNPFYAVFNKKGRKMWKKF